MSKIYDTISTSEAIELFNDRFEVGINDFLQLEKHLSNTTINWKKIPQWGEGAKEGDIYKYCDIKNISEQVLVITDATYSMGGGAFLWNGEAIDLYIKNYRSEIGESFFENGDVLLIWLTSCQVMFFHEEGVFAMFNKHEVATALSNPA